MSTSAPAQRPADHGSRTLTVTPTPSSDAGPSNPDAPNEGGNTIGVLRLRGGPTRRQKVVWTDETVDNEGMGKKKSKICCIYHRPKAYDESSSESSSGSDDGNSDKPRRDDGDADRPSRRLAPGDSKAQAEVEEDSSESEGGRGGGTARPPRKPRRHRHHHHSHSDQKQPPKANRYDLQGKPSGKATGPV